MVPRRFLCVVFLAAVLGLGLAPAWAEQPAVGDPNAFPPPKLLQKLAPHSLIRTLVAFERTMALRARNPRVYLPRMTFLLDQGHQVTGVIIRTDFDQNRLSVLLAEKGFVVNVTFLEFRQIHGFIMHDVDLCPEFVDELAKEN